MKIIDQLKKVNLIQFVPAIFVISLVGNSVFGYTAPKSEKSKNNSENQVEAATTQAKKKTKKANAGDIDLSKIKDGTYEGQANHPQKQADLLRNLQEVLVQRMNQEHTKMVHLLEQHLDIMAL